MHTVTIPVPMFVINLLIAGICMKIGAARGSRYSNTYRGAVVVVLMMVASVVVVSGIGAGTTVHQVAVFFLCYSIGFIVSPILNALSDMASSWKNLPI